MSDVVSVVKAQKNGPLIAEAARLWIEPGTTVLDVTYGRGNFWTDFRPGIHQPGELIAHDLITLDGVDFRKLPEDDDSIDVVVFDPPYVAPGGRKTSGIQEMHDRFGMAGTPKNPDLLFDYIAKGHAECARVVKPKGIVLVKCMDYVWGGKLRLGRHHAVTSMMENGLIQVDEFVHVSGTGPQPKGRVQRHSRRAHSFLCVFQKPSSR